MLYFIIDLLFRVERRDWMTKIVAYLAKLGFWPFIFLFTALATLLAELLILPLNYGLTGNFLDLSHQLPALVVSIVVGVLLFYFIAYLIRHLLLTQERLKKAQEALKDSNQRLESVQAVAHLGFWEFDMEQDILYWSDEVYRIFGLEPQEFKATYEGFMNYVHPDDREILANEYQRSIDEKSCYSLVHRIVQKNGAIRYVEERCEHSYDDSGKPVKSIGAVYDITERIADQSKLQRLFDLQRNIVIQTNGIVLLKANHSFLHFLGYTSLEDFLKEYNCICDLFIKDDRFFHLGKVPEGKNWIEVLETFPKKERVVSLLNAYDHPRAFSVSINHFDDDDYIVAFTDISETILEQFSLEERASRDHLTGAYNRSYFDENIEEILESAQKRNRYIGFIMLDIDHFKNVNDTFGHDVGDTVLKHLVTAIRYSIRNEDMLVRFGGEEFLLVIETDTAGTLNRIAEHVRQRIEDEHFETVGRITCSLGMTIHVPGELISQSIKRADVALYKAKGNGRNKVVQDADIDVQLSHTHFSMQ